jgi:hypothetical protein
VTTWRRIPLVVDEGNGDRSAGVGGGAAGSSIDGQIAQAIAISREILMGWGAILIRNHIAL